MTVKLSLTFEKTLANWAAMIGMLSITSCKNDYYVGWSSHKQHQTVGYC